MRQDLEAIQYDPEDVALIYPSGDELALYENQYASQQSQVEVNPPESARAIPAPETVEATEKTESVFGGGAVNKPALEETAEKMPEQAPEEFFTHADREPEEFWPEEGTEKTESVFGHGAEDPYLTDFVPDAGEGQTDGVKKRSPIARITAIIAVIFILALLLLGALWPLGFMAFGGLKKSTDPVVPESLQEYEAAGTLERMYRDDGSLGTYVVWTYDGDTLVQEQYFSPEGVPTMFYGYDESGNIIWKETHNELGGIEQFEEYDSEGNCVRSDVYNLDGTLSAVYEYDNAGNCVRVMRYNPDGTLREVTE